MSIQEAIEYLENPCGKSLEDHKEAVKLAVKALQMMDKNGK